MSAGPNDPMQDVDVIVVGAGIIGVACALYLQRDGRSVAIIDPEEPGEKCSYGNSGSFGVGVIAPAGMPDMPWRVPRMLVDSSGSGNRVRDEFPGGFGLCAMTSRNSSLGGLKPSLQQYCS